MYIQKDDSCKPVALKEDVIWVPFTKKKEKKKAHLIVLLTFEIKWWLKRMFASCIKPRGRGCGI